MTPIDQTILQSYKLAEADLYRSYTAFVNNDARDARRHLQNMSHNLENLTRHWDQVLVEQDEKESTSGFLKLQLAGLQHWLSKETDPTRRCVVASRIEEVKQELARIETP